jgi:hypothetical protein
VVVEIHRARVEAAYVRPLAAAGFEAIRSFCLDRLSASGQR